MRRLLPTMISLSCFEATARLMSVTEAAQELHLTQSAVSRQIKKLEQQLGCQLFRRVRQRLQLTDAGRNYAQEVSHLLNQLEAASRQVAGGSAGKLRVGVEPSFTTHWLLPRLGEFSAAHPEIELEIMNDLRRLYERQEGFDIGILFGDGQWPGLETDYMMPVELVAVATPALYRRYGAIEQPADLLNYPVLHHTTYAASSQLSSTWLWLHHAGFSDDEIQTLPGQRIEHFQFVLDATLHGLGATVLPHYLVEPAIADGRLVKACENTLNCGGYYTAVRPQQASNPALQQFREWLHQVAE